CENGYTKIANEIMEALMRFRIPGEARQMLDAIIRKTYGFNKKEDTISSSQFVEMTGLPKFIIHRARKRLQYANLITVSKNANSPYLTYSLQKDFSKWIPVCKNANSKQKSHQVYAKKVTKGVTNIDGHKRHYNTKETNTKEIEYPDWFPLKAFEAFKIMRTKIKKPLTEQAVSLLIKKLELLKNRGENPEEVLNQSTMNCWQSIYEVKDKKRIWEE
ncbi:MAG: replication protein, partial [Nanoarchaeota archaeon]